MSIIKNLVAASVVSTFSASVYAAPITIGFDDLADGVVVGSSYAGLGVTFTNAETGPYGGLPGGSAPRAIVHDTLFSTFGPSDAIVALFSSAVSSVGLTAIDVGEAGFLFTAYDSLVGGSIVDTDSFVGVGIGVGAFHTLTLTGSGIRRVEFSQITAGAGGDGVAFDNFAFDVAAVPEPASSLLLGIGIAGLAASRRRKQ